MSNDFPSRRPYPPTPSDFFKGLLGFKFFDDLVDKGFLPETPNIRADIKETDKEYILEAEMPGFNKENIAVEWQNGQLDVAAKQDQETKEEKGSYIKRERHYGEVSRSFRVDGIKEQEISAEYKDGILRVVMPKIEPTPESKKKITIV